MDGAGTKTLLGHYKEMNSFGCFIGLNQNGVVVIVLGFQNPNVLCPRLRVADSKFTMRVSPSKHNPRHHRLKGKILIVGIGEKGGKDDQSYFKR